MIPDYISDDLSYLPESSKEDAEKLAKELNIETKKLKNKIIQIFNEDINKLNDTEISFYYSVYLYLINQEKRELEQQNKFEEQKRTSNIFSQIKEYNKKEYNEEHLKELLNSLNTDGLAKVIEHLFYLKRTYTIAIEDKRFSVLIENIDKKIIIDIILDKYKWENNNFFKKLFLKTHITTWKSKVISFLESINYETYIKFKSLIFLKNTFRTTQFYTILKKYIEYTKTEKYKEYSKWSLEEDFEIYYDYVRDVYKWQFPEKRYPKKYYKGQK